MILVPLPLNKLERMTREHWCIEHIGDPSPSTWFILNSIYQLSNKSVNMVEYNRYNNAGLTRCLAICNHETASAYKLRFGIS